MTNLPKTQQENRCSHALRLEDFKSKDWYEERVVDDINRIRTEIDTLEYLYVPSICLYVAKKSIYGTYWTRTHEALQADGFCMPTLEHYVEFLKYLKFDKKQSKSKESERILREIFKPTKSDAPLCGWSAEWIDARFVKVNKGIYLCSEHRIEGHYLKPKKVEKLSPETRGWFWEGCVESSYCEGAAYVPDERNRIDLEDWLTNPTKQGLPKEDCKLGKNHYDSPLANLGTVYNENAVYPTRECRESVTTFGNSYGHGDEAALVCRKLLHHSAYRVRPVKPA